MSAPNLDAAALWRLARLFGAALVGIAEHADCQPPNHHAEPCPRCDATHAIDPEAIASVLAGDDPDWEEAHVAPGYFRLLDGVALPGLDPGTIGRDSVRAGVEALRPVIGRREGGA